MTDAPPYLTAVTVLGDRVSASDYPFHLPAVRTLDLRFRTPVTFFVGENGTGKSTVMEWASYDFDKKVPAIELEPFNLGKN